MSEDEKKQLEALALKIDAEIASKHQINEALAASQAALGVANAKIAELEAALAAAPAPAVDSDAEELAALQADIDKLDADLV